MLDKIVDLIWERLEPRIERACAEGYKKGEIHGYVAGKEDGYVESADDIIRRMTTVYDVVRHNAQIDAYADAGAIDIKDISAEEFDATIDDLGAME